jgi:hypothetical protein
MSGTNFAMKKNPIEDHAMKQFVTGVAVTAALALAAPVWAHSGSPAQLTTTALSVPAKPGASTNAPKHRRARHVAHLATANHSRAAGARTSAADGLNAAELQRVRTEETASAAEAAGGFGSSLPPEAVPSSAGFGSSLPPPALSTSGAPNPYVYPWTGNRSDRREYGKDNGGP